MSFIREYVVKKVSRSAKWPKIRKQHLKKFPYCANCGKKKIMMQVHHIKPFHLYPQLELDPDNLLTLCGDKRCHLDKGHLGYWKSYNLFVVEDCKVWKDKYKNRP